MPLSTIYWSGGIFWGSYLAIFVCGLCLIRMNFFCRAVCRGKPGRMKVALTFDDGPDPKATPQLLELLKREEVPATFFCVGKNVVAHPEIAKRIAAEGHLLGNHSYTHPWYVSVLGGAALRGEMERTQDAIESASGVRPRYFRPPSGMTGPNFPGAEASGAEAGGVGREVIGYDGVAEKSGGADRAAGGGWEHYPIARWKDDARADRGDCERGGAGTEIARVWV